MVNLPEECLVRSYLDGLRVDAQVNVRMFQPQTIKQCFSVGRLYEMAHSTEPIARVELKTTQEVAMVVQENDSSEEIELVSDGAMSMILNHATSRQHGSGDLHYSASQEESIQNMRITHKSSLNKYIQIWHYKFRNII
ncbi:hypothetical protein Bca52824_087639 [Brassica carinata]|uniref:Uncharacterized protein n=1 Tax=Brassica carinata TaxID=52824 RepID=A0A8X7TNU8_BRACI|nr:hypothetical protein Bca52824_087639 [Brassica carinata]